MVLRGSLAIAAAAAVGVIGLGVAGQGLGRASSISDWVTYGGNLQSTNDAVAAAFTAASAKRLAEAWKTKLDGAVYAPLLLVTTAGRRRLLVETQADTVYELDAATGKVLWRHSVGPPIQTTCGSPFGITSAPAIDTRRNRLYVIGAPGVLQALSLSTGKQVPGWRIQIVDRPTAENVWSSVRLVGATAYIATASYCDKPDPMGRPADGDLYAVDVVTHTITHTYDVVPGPYNLGGIWGWGGISVSQTGTIYTATGNAEVTRDGNLIEAQPYAERVLALSPALKLLRASGVPPRAQSNLGDEDFGSTPLLFQPSGCRPLVAANSKDGRTLVYDQATLKLVWSRSIGPTNANHPFLGQPSWDAADRQLVVANAQFGSVSDPDHGVSVYRPNRNCSSFAKGWSVNIGGGPQPPPLIAGGVVFALAPPVGALYAIDTKRGLIVWSTEVGYAVAPLATDNESVYAAGTDGVVHAFTTP